MVKTGIDRTGDYVFFRGQEFDGKFAIGCNEC